MSHIASCAGAEPLVAGRQRDARLAGDESLVTWPFSVARKSFHNSVAPATAHTKRALLGHHESVVEALVACIGAVGTRR